MSTVGSPRRYYLLKSREATKRRDGALASAWRALQLGQPGGAALPATLAGYAALTAAGYVATNDVVGADEAELRDAGLSPSDARDVVAAYPDPSLVVA